MFYKLSIIFNLIFLCCTNIIQSQHFTSANNIVDSSVTISFSVVGDLMCHSTQFNYARQDDSTFNFKPVFREIKKYFDNSDIVIGNLETVVVGDELEYTGYPVFNTPEDYLKGLKYAGFDILVTGNNHAYDHRKKGVLNTIYYVQKNDMINSGTYSSQEKRDSIQLFEQSGLKFSLLSYTYSVNLYRVPKEKSFLVNRIDPELIKSDIQKAKAQNSELVIVYFHFGSEYSRSESKYQKDIVEKTINYGADIIIGAHTHTLQPVEIFKTNNANIDSGFVAYSLGNFVSNQRWRYSDGSAILNFSVTKDLITDEVKIDEIRYLPIWVFKGVSNWGLEYLILPSDIAISNTYPSYFTEEDKNLMLECYGDTREIMESRTNKNILDSIEKSSLRKWKIEQKHFRSFISIVPYMSDNLRQFSARTDSLEYLSNE